MKSLTRGPAASQFTHLAFSDLLERAGFHVRGKRADCPRCQSAGHGHGRGTVAFSGEVFFCHRCKYTGNVRTLSRALGLPILPEDREHRERRERAKRFSEWLNVCYAVLVRRLHFLRERADVARRFLAEIPDSGDGWDVLAEYYHERTALFAALDFLACDPLSTWLEQPMNRERLFAAFSDVEKPAEVSDTEWERPFAAFADAEVRSHLEISDAE
jgi:hypothetical protein